MADKKNQARAGEAEKDEKTTGVSRWKQEEGGGKKRRRTRSRKGLPKGAGTQIFALVVALALVACAVAAAWPPAERLGWGTDFAGGTSYTYVADSDADLASAAGTVRSRLERMGVTGASVTAEDGTLTVKLPAAHDDASAVEEATGVGTLELVRLDAVSDADAIARIQSGSTDVTLEEGTYEPFIQSSQITSAAAVLTSSTSASYGLTLSFDSEGAAAFEEVTAELAPVYGQILIVADGTVVAAPQVSQAISGGQVSVSAGLTQQEATGIAAAVETGELPCALTQQASESVAPVVGTSQFLQAVIVAGVVVLALLVALLFWMRLLGLVAWAGLVALCFFEVGGLALLSGEGIFVPSVTAYLAAAVAVLVVFAASLYYLAGVRSRMRAGTNARDAVRVTLRAQSRELAVVAAVLAVGGTLLYFFYSFGGYPTFSSGLCLPVAVVSGALSVFLVTVPLVRLAALGPMRSHPGAWGVSRRDADER